MIQIIIFTTITIYGICYNMKFFKYLITRLNVSNFGSVLHLENLNILVSRTQSYYKFFYNKFYHLVSEKSTKVQNIQFIKKFSNT